MVEIIGWIVGGSLGLLWAAASTRGERKAVRRVSWEAFKALGKIGN